MMMTMKMEKIIFSKVLIIFNYIVDKKVIRKLRDYKDDLKDNSISHYILPIIEGYVTTKDKLRNIGLEALETIGFT